MIAQVIWAAGLVLVAEGLVVALAPGRLDAALDAFRRMTPEARRLAGLAGLAVGAALLTIARALGA